MEALPTTKCSATNCTTADWLCPGLSAARKRRPTPVCRSGSNWSTTRRGGGRRWRRRSSSISTKSGVPAEKFAAYLGESRLIPIRGPITDLARRIPLPEGEPLRAARKVYDYLVDTMVYNYLAPGAGKGDAVWACNSKTGDCSDFNSIFIGVCRWRGIPADHVFGPPIPSEGPEGDSQVR